MIARNNALRALCLLVLCLAGCTELDKPEQISLTGYLSLDRQTSLGQSFVAHQDGLQSIILYLQPEVNGDGILQLHLRLSPQDQEDVASSQIRVSDVKTAGYYRLSFPKLADSNQKDYYLMLRLNGPGSLQVGQASEAAYPDGSLYRDRVPQEAQLHFILGYSRSQAFLGLANEFLTWLGWVITAIFLFVIPGWGLLGCLWPGWKTYNWETRLGLSTGGSLALFPLLMLACDALGFHPGRLIAWLLPLLGLTLILQRNLRRILNFKPHFALETSPFIRSGNRLWAGLALVFVMICVIGVRFWHIRSLEVPMWGDAYQHTLIAQLMVDQGGLFSSWEPYVPFHSLSVHFGFSALAAAFTWLTGAPTVKAALIVGQLVNAAAVINLVPLAERLANGNRFAGLGALLVGGLLSRMPAYYVNWGRYAQLSGQAILPIAIFLVLQALEKEALPNPVRKIAGYFSFLLHLLVCGAALTGMMLHYYRMPYYFAFYIFAWLLVWGVPQWRLDLRQWLRVCLKLAVIALTAFLFFLPWYLHLAGGRLSDVVEAGISSQPTLSTILNEYRIWQDAPNYLSIPLIFLAIVAFLWSLARRNWQVAALGLWTTWMAAYYAGRLIHLPGANLSSSFSILISLYIPASLLIGWLLSELTQSRFFQNGVVVPRVLVLAIIIVAVWSAWKQRLIPQPRESALVTRSDLRAMSWIRQNIPADSIFLVEGYRVFGGASAVGSDGGWWLPLLAGRRNTMPPQYALLNESPEPPDYSRRVVELVAKLETNSPGSPEGFRALCSMGVTHVYVGQWQGKQGYGATQLFSAESLLNAPQFDLVYAQDRVRIFAIKPGFCQPVS